MQTLYPNQIVKIAEIINRSHCEEEKVLINGVQAAVNILQYLTDEGMIGAKVVQMEIKEAKAENY